MRFACYYDVSRALFLVPVPPPGPVARDQDRLLFPPYVFAGWNLLSPDQAADPVSGQEGARVTGSGYTHRSIKTCNIPGAWYILNNNYSLFAFREFSERALFVQKEKAGTIRRIPPISPN